MPSTMMNTTTSISDMPVCRPLLDIAGLGIDGNRSSGDVQHHALTWLTQPVERERGGARLHDYGHPGRRRENVRLTVHELRKRNACRASGGIAQRDLSRLN